ncbi:16S rRNA (adenine(1518)-N(6)/adenine(1519)-N(6))-dimethyltransferase RsmA [Rubritalea profundi]|uniref:Ribosomal RNA small subunit methyltransferase A n=1 Tax=Rubritalea profundi TaxID=1658618 RepID=A0A2S7TWJ2_9BACT|nr:16S rRNA (adenine(1518)-N(6)/adenine(1519)-N(6))-dimethyltransferase RsmA [Rubritalea profundi]PQJ27115.1 ribosomal RNA small subunit methyltransferase A [Rubritalea profundi]
MNIGEIKKVLSDAGVTPSRQLGQNFLCDAKVARGIVDQLHPNENDVVVECGPGTGALTVHLVGRVKKVILIEFDARLAEYQTDKYADNADVEVHHADAARFDIRDLFKYGPIKLLGNLPYSAGGAIMRNFMKRPTMVSRAVLMLQKEFIDRIIAVPRTKDYGVLTLRMQSEWVSKPVMLVPPDAFTPPPKIDSTVMVCEPKPEGDLPVYDARLFDELIRRGFSQRRKQIKKQLPDHLAWEDVAAKMGLKLTARAEEISLEDWIEITRLYDDNPLKDIPQKDDEIFDVVDENDEVVRQETRKNVHAQNLTHRAVHIFVFNKNKDILLQKRSILKDKFPGCWDSSAAGHLDAGESYGDCVVRELGEELGIEGVDTQKIAKIPASEKTGFEFIELHLARYDGALRFPCSEVSTAEWFTMEQVREWVTARPEDYASGFIECWNLFEEKMGAAKEV